MRLTLRTLLAYLDDTLEPQDAEILRAKLAESGFATQLVQRIRASLINPNLSAPAPDAVAPVEDANLICEYLDSTLSPEQVAEIERACLESEPLLAEAAACHQVLTMVLGQPAEVSRQLRRRIYELPDRELKEISSGGSFSSLAIPEEPDSARPGELPAADPTHSPLAGSDDIPTLDQPPTPAGKTVHPSEPVTPVGPADSGVSDAPTRLRQAGAIADLNDGPNMAGDRRVDPLQRSDMYGGSIRPSRITPWLVSLALAAVLLFALAQIFSPLLRTRTASREGDSIGEDEVLVAPEDTPPMVALESSPENLGADGSVESLPAPDTSAVDSAESVMNESEIEAPAVEDQEMATAAPNHLKSDGSAESEEVEVMQEPAADDTSDDPSVSVDRSDADARPQDETEANLSDSGQSELRQSDPGVAMDDPDTGAAKESATKGKSAKVLSDKTLLVGRIGDGDWQRLSKDTTVGPGVTIACAPLFQGHMTSAAGVDVMLVGPTNVAWESGDDELATTLAVENGRVLVGSLKPDVTIGLRLGTTVLGLRFADPEAVVAITRSHFRAPGFDPLQAENHLPIVSILAVQGTAELTLNDATTDISTGQQWTRRGERDVEVEPLETAPAWIEDPDADQEDIYTLARDMLLELIDVDQPIAKSLREATTFRRSEVAALAGRSLLTMGIGDVYFGGDGLLSRTDQRNYWPDHYRALVDTIDRDDSTAAELLDSIRAMESADAETLFRLLVGYSQKQLVEGSDERLVDGLDSNSMAVRVLSLENLRAITGNTLNFKADQDNAVRRAPEIKKWLVRLRKGDIRWQPAS